MSRRKNPATPIIKIEDEVSQTPKSGRRQKKIQTILEVSDYADLEVIEKKIKPDKEHTIPEEQPQTFSKADDQKNPHFVLATASSINMKTLQNKILSNMQDSQVDIFSLPTTRSNFGKLEAQNAMISHYITRQVALEWKFYFICFSRHADESKIRDLCGDEHPSAMFLESRKFLSAEQLVKNKQHALARGRSKTASTDEKKHTAMLAPSRVITPFGGLQSLTHDDQHYLREICNEIRMLKDQVMMLSATMYRNHGKYKIFLKFKPVIADIVELMESKQSGS